MRDNEFNLPQKPNKIFTITPKNLFYFIISHYSIYIVNSNQNHDQLVAPSSIVTYLKF